MTVPVRIHPNTLPNEAALEAHHVTKIALAGTTTDAPSMLVQGGCPLDPNIPLQQAVRPGAAVIFAAPSTISARQSQCNTAPLDEAGCDTSSKETHAVLTDDPEGSGSELDAAKAAMDELTELHLQSLKEAIGPKLIAVKNTEAQVNARARLLGQVLRKLELSEYGLVQDDTSLFTTRLKHDLSELQNVLATRQAEFDRALETYREMERRSIRRLAVPMHMTMDEYRSVYEALPQNDLIDLAREIETVTNVEPLVPGEEVRFDEGGDAFILAQVSDGPLADGAYHVRVGVEETNVDLPYQMHFNRTARVHRSRLYARPILLSQPPAGSTAATLAQQRGRGDVPPRSVDSEYLAELVARAEAVRPRFQATVHRILATAELTDLAQIHFGALKRPARIAQKSAEKYGGDYSRVCDLVRMTIVCDSIKVVTQAFLAIAQSDGLRVERVKNRLHPAFDATTSVGYRDVLLNVRDVISQHVCEIQLTLRQFHDIKIQGGHAMYKVLRLVGRLEDWYRTHQGDAADEVTAVRLADGAVSELDVTGSDADAVIRNVTPAMASSRCFLSILKLNFVTATKTSWDTVLSSEVLAQHAKSLEVLETSYCKWSGPVPLGLQQCGRLRRLHFGFNTVVGGIPTWLGNLNRLQFLNMEFCDLTGSIPPSLGQLSCLRVLDLCSNNLSGEIPEELGGLSQLTELSLNINNLSGEIPASLGGLTRIVDLWLGTNCFTGSIPATLGNLTELSELYLEDNQLDGPIPPQLGNLTGLTKIMLAHNRLSGEIPDALGNLVHLKEMYLNDNSLSGPIPASFHQLCQLEELCLANNRLSGQLPEWLGELDCLTEIRVERNELSGPIPESVSMLPHLKELHVYGNALVGTVPPGLSRFSVIYESRTT